MSKPECAECAAWEEAWKETYRKWLVGHRERVPDCRYPQDVIPGTRYLHQHEEDTGCREYTHVGQAVAEKRPCKEWMKEREASG